MSRGDKDPPTQRGICAGGGVSDISPEQINKIQREEAEKNFSFLKKLKNKKQGSRLPFKGVRLQTKIFFL